MDRLVSANAFLFGNFRLDPSGLFRLDPAGGMTPVALGSRALDLLRVIAERQGQLVTKDEIMDAVWPGMTVEEGNLTVQISALRRILDQAPAQRSCIQTVIGRGYRFLTSVTLADAASPAVAVEPGNSGEPPRRVPRLSIVVLPFVNLSNDPDQEHLADAVTDDLTTDISRIHGIFVISRSTAFAYKGKAGDVRQIGRELGVRYVLEGSARRAGDQVHVNVQLVDAESGAQLWADRFDTDRGKFAGAESEIVARLAWTIKRELLVATGRLIEQDSAANGGARDLEMRGWGVWRRPQSAANFREALQLFEQAFALDPASIGAKNGIAAVLVNNFAMGWSSTFQQDQVLAEHLLLDILAADSNEVTAHLTLGILRRLQGRLDEAKIELETTVALDPSNIVGITQIGQTLTFLGQPEAAIPYLEKAIRLCPNDPIVYSPYGSLGLCRLLLGDADQAIELYRKARAVNPRFYIPHLFLAAALGFRGDREEARAALADSMSVKPEINSLAALRIARPWEINPQYVALRAKTVEVGLRRAGMPEE